mmetsp:Transcript_39998/g.103532  ORF Transcript_39998/g.103532 Transcript_39998/m.103532 type:complete len:234 (+) Transcript_39998:165-866(+)
MPSPRAAISEVTVAMPSLASSMAVCVSLTVSSRPFFLSPVMSNWAAQFSFLRASSSCSSFSAATRSSISLTTFSKPPWESAFLPVKASAIKSRAGRWELWARPFRSRIMERARALWEEALKRTCSKLEAAPGSVCLKRSSASSSFKTLMVSARATSSSARVFWRSSHSWVFVEQLDSSSAKNFLSSMRAASVSVRSPCISTMATPSSPICAVFASTAFEQAATSFFLAAISAS